MKTLLFHALLSTVAATRPGFIYDTTASVQLASSVANIATASFPPDKILLVSNTEYDDMVDIMLKHVHQYALWNLHVFRSGALGLQRMRELEDKVGSCVIFTKGAEDLMSQTDGLMRSTSWNNTALFLVVVPRFPMASPEQLALSIAKELWENARVFNVVLLVEHDKAFHLYTWFPYRPHKQCGEVSEVEVIDVLSGADSRNFATNTRLFAYRVPKNFWGCPITVSIMYTDDMAHNLISNFLLRLNFNVSYKVIINDSLDYRTRAIEVLSDFVLGTTEIVAPIVLYRDMVKLGKPSHEVDSFEFAWHVPCAKPIRRIHKITKIFSTSLWIALIAVTTSVGIIMWQLARKSLEDNAYKNVSIVLYNAWAVAVGVCVTKMPRSYHLRIVMFAWISYCFSISTIFQTFFTTFLVNPGFQKQVTNLHELVQSKMPYGVPPGLKLIYSQEDTHMNLIDKEHECYNFTECVQRIIDTGNFALLEQSRKVKKYLKSVKKNNCVCVMNNVDVHLMRMVAFFSQKTLIWGQFNTFVTHMLESGEIAKIDRGLWTISSYPADEEVTSGGYFVFNMSHLLVAFYVLIIGHCTGFATFLLELLRHLYSICRQRSDQRTIT